ncbi:hypothetical protein LEP1GSC037_0411 [Leptospira interrogans str. 2006001854]|uniref:Leucine rich repeat protein n=1 Tax=Leptospira interrogans str. 2006001854 TaxID=1001590 RepID=M6G7G5_LEPIR|nr:hypothetical protein LEP1GSC037_0411 [Leptospira interrogans str. 2006001854]
MVLFFFSLNCSSTENLKTFNWDKTSCISNKAKIESYHLKKWNGKYVVQDFDKIVSISDSEGKIDDQILAYTCCFPNLERLSAINSKNQVTDQGIKIFTECHKGNKHLESLMITSGGITDESILYISQLKSLGVLYLDQNNLTNKSIPYFERFKNENLELSIVETKISNDKIEKLADKMPNLKIKSKFH